MQSIDNAIARKTLLRIRGVLGASFHHLSPSVRNALITFRPYLFPQPRRTPEIPDLSFITIPESGFPVTAFRAHDGKNVPVIPRDPPEFALRDYRRHEVQQVVAAIDDGMEVVSATGLSGSGKTEGLIWNLERELAARGHRVVALDVMRISHALTGHGLGTLLDEIDDAIRPTVFIFDESVYFGDGKLKEAVVRFTDRFLRHRGNHLIFVGGGTISPEKKRRLIEERLFVIWDERRTAHVTLFPKPINLHQAYRFLGLARIHWMSEEEKVEFLQYLFERIPPFFVMYMNLRLHEHPEITTLAQAKAAVDEEVDPRFWREAMGTISS